MQSAFQHSESKIIETGEQNILSEYLNSQTPKIFQAQKQSQLDKLEPSLQKQIIKRLSKIAQCGSLDAFVSAVKARKVPSFGFYASGNKFVMSLGLNQSLILSYDSNPEEITIEGVAETFNS